MTQAGQLSPYLHLQPAAEYHWHGCTVLVPLEDYLSALLLASIDGSPWAPRQPGTEQQPCRHFGMLDTLVEVSQRSQRAMHAPTSNSDEKPAAPLHTGAQVPEEACTALECWQQST